MTGFLKTIYANFHGTITRMIIIPHIEREQELWTKGFINVAGVDEAGKGPLAGPVSAGAVVIHNPDQIVSIVRDSKYMTEKQREEAYKKIKEESSGWGVGLVQPSEIDEIGIELAVKKAMLMALEQIEINFGLSLSYVIVDGSRTKPLERYPSQRILRGGLYHYSIAAGSILAKVTRDHIMYDYAKEYPEYGFEKHVGYGTKYHLETIKRHGPSPIHRLSFAPLRTL